MKDLTKSESSYLKHGDLEEILGKRWEDIDVTATCEWTRIEKYPDGKPAFCMKFARLEKPLGLNKTNLRTLSEMFPHVEDFPSSAFEGQRFRLICVETEMGPGIRIRAPRDTTQEETQKARERIAQAQRDQGVEPKGDSESERFANEEIPPPTDGDQPFDDSDIPF